MVKRLLENKRFVFFISLPALLALIALASALNNLTFRAAQPIARPESGPQSTRLAVDKMVKAFLDIPLSEQIAFFIMLFLIVILIAALLSPDARKRLIRMFIRAALTVFIISYLIQTNPTLLDGLFPQINFQAAATDSALLVDSAPPVFEPPQISSLLSFFITFGIMVIAAIFAWRVYLWWKRQNEFLNAAPPFPLSEIGKIARATLRTLSQQESSRDAIIQCYEKMNEAASTRRGAHRSYTMTAAEFAQKLERAGLPREPVNQLTRLFESARYSTHISTQQDIDEAAACLTSILKYCGETQ